MSAVAGGNLEIVKMFVKAGADKNVLNPILGETALDIAESREKAEIAAYLWSVGAKRSKELSPSEPHKESVTETFWQLPDDLFLSVSVEPSPPKAGMACLSVEISAGERGYFAGEIEYRLTEVSRDPGPWNRLYDGKIAEGGSVRFSDEVTLVNGTIVLEFRIREEGANDFVYPESWKIIAT